MSFGLVSGLTKGASNLVGDVVEDTAGIVSDAVGNVSEDVRALAGAGVGSDVYRLPGCEILGSGYDVLNGFYASPKSCRTVLFKFSDTTEPIKVGTRVFNKPVDISYHSSFHTEMYTSSGKTIDEYTKSISSSTKVEGNYNFFSASTEADFGESSAKSQDSAFSKVSYRVDQYTLQLPPKHPEYLDPKVRKDIDEMDLTKLFQTYGTHYLAGLIMGGSAAYTSVTKKSTFNSKHDLSVAAQMSFKSAVGSLSAEEKVTYGSTVKSFNESSRSSTTTYGGDPRYGNEKFPQYTSEWSNSVGDYLTFIDFLGERSLLGIWELASTPKRFQEIKAFYPDYCEGHQRKFIVEDGPVLRAKVVPLTNLRFSDDGSGADANLGATTPDVATGAGWYYLGQVAVTGDRVPKGSTLLVQEIYPGVLVDVHHWEKVWDDHGSKKHLNYNLWRGVAFNPVDYQVVGDFFRGQVSTQFAPSEEESAGIKAVSVRCLVRGQVGDKIWSDKGSNASDNGSIWKIVPGNASEAIDMSKIEPYFVATKSHDAKPTRPVYVLKKEAVQFV